MSVLSEFIKNAIGGETAYKNVTRKGGDVLARGLGGFVGSGGNPLLALLAAGTGLWGDADPLTAREFGQNALWSAVGSRAASSIFPALRGSGIPGLPPLLGGVTDKPGIFQGVPILGNLKNPIQRLLPGIGAASGYGGGGGTLPWLPIALSGIGAKYAYDEGKRQEERTAEAVDRFQRSLSESGPIEAQTVEEQLAKEKQARERQGMLEQGALTEEAQRTGPEYANLRQRILQERRNELSPISARFSAEEARAPEAYRALSTQEAPLFSAQKAAEQGSIQDTIKAIEASRAAQRAGIEQRTGETARKFFEQDITPSVMNALSRRGILDSGALQAQLAKEAARLQAQRESALLPFDIETSRATSLGLLPELIQSERDIGRQALGRNLGLDAAGLEEQRNIARSRLGQETAFDLGTSQAATLGLLPEALGQEQALRRAGIESKATLGRQGIQSEADLQRDLLARRFGRGDISAEMGLISDIGAQQRRGELLKALIDSIGRLIPPVYQQLQGDGSLNVGGGVVGTGSKKLDLPGIITNLIGNAIGGKYGNVAGNFAGNLIDGNLPEEARQNSLQEYPMNFNELFSDQLLPEQYNFQGDQSTGNLTSQGGVNDVQFPAIPISQRRFIPTIGDRAGSELEQAVLHYPDLQEHVSRGLITMEQAVLQQKVRDKQGFALPAEKKITDVINELKSQQKPILPTMNITERIALYGENQKLQEKINRLEMILAPRIGKAPQDILTPYLRELTYG